MMPGYVDAGDRLTQPQTQRETPETNAETPLTENNQNHVISTRTKTRPRRKLRLNVGGVVFVTYARTLRRQPTSKLGRLTEADDNYDPESQEYFFDRNPLVFHGVLDYFRTGELHVSHDICAGVIRTELHFWGIDVKELSECCWLLYGTCLSEQESIRDVGLTFCHDEGLPPLKNATKWQRYCRTGWNILEYPRSSITAKVWLMFFSLAVFISIFVTVFESMPAFRVSHTDMFLQFMNRNATSKELLALTTRLHPVLVYLEIGSSVLLTIELILRLIFCPNKSEFFKSILTWIEIFTQFMVWYVASYYLYLSVNSQLELDIFSAAVCLRNMRVLRVFRIAKHIPAWRLLMLAMKESQTEIMALLAFVLTGVLIFAVLIYATQFYTEDKFTSIPIGFWWAIVTMTTVGYGDFYPTSVQGYFVGALCALCGMLATGLPIPLIANNFNTLHTYFKLRRERKGPPCSLVGGSMNDRPEDIDTESLEGALSLEPRLALDALPNGGQENDTFPREDSLSKRTSGREDPFEDAVSVTYK